MFSFNGPDARARHLRDLRKARNRARAWGVWAATVGGSALVAVPYAGLGLPDILWAGAAGGATAMALLRRRDHRELAAAPVPEPEVRRALTIGQRLAPLLGPRFGALIDHPHRVVLPAGSPGAEAAQRLNNAARVLPQMLDRLGPYRGQLPAEAESAHVALRDLGNRLALVERTLASAAPEARPALLAARDDLVARFVEGVDAYEALTTAAAECVAAVSRGGEDSVSVRLTEAADRLAGMSYGLNTVHETTRQYDVN
ncbi:phage shock envelope stress response protein PspM [Cryptosporangium aurantiacum]|uniref:Uncharacterized protein n=1 Tax=Cryptosporangium aurantiacum TaxID=134849 RepID=A0A1M7ITM6_9ACTN|nr:hypothetical protein [Cryptosporangium aurantiacum]SHM43968.1 hypothetical protein SAMN05443668_101586 [Cryptosporangium aurantiacum]